MRLREYIYLVIHTLTLTALLHNINYDRSSQIFVYSKVHQNEINLAKNIQETSWGTSVGADPVSDELKLARSDAQA